MKRHLIRNIAVFLLVAACLLLPVAGFAQNVPFKFGGITPNAWTGYGPGNIGGPVTAIVTHPTDANTLYIGVDGGGIWKTTDSGAHWTSLTGNFLNSFSLSVTCLVMDKTNPNVLYAGTAGGDGIFKTTDGGNTWTNLISTAKTGQFYWSYISDLAISPANPNILLAALSDGLGRSTDGGVTWQIILGENYTYDIDFHPTDGNKAIATGGDFWITNDAGVTWSNINTQLDGGGEFAYAPSNPNIIYCLSTGAVPPDFNPIGRLSVSTDGGQTFSIVSPEDVDLVGPEYIGKPLLWVDPANANNVIVGGTFMWRTQDGGVNWQKVTSTTTLKGFHTAVEAITYQSPPFVPGPRKVYVACENGIVRADDILIVGSNNQMTRLNNELSITPILHAAVHANSQFLLGSTRNNGVNMFFSSAFTWSVSDPIRTGTWGRIVDDPQADADGSFYMSVVNDHWHITRKKFNSDGTFRTDWNSFAGPGADFDQHLPLPPFVGDPTNANVCYLGGRSLWRNTNLRTAIDFTAVWEEAKPGIDNRWVNEIAIKPGQSSEIWVGYTDGSIFKTTNGTAQTPAWTDLTPAHHWNLNSSNSDPRVERIIFDPGVNTVYVLVKGNPDTVWKTADGGTTWVQLTNPPIPQLADVAVHPAMHNRLYVATADGVFASENGGQSWSPSTVGPVDGEITDLFWRTNVLVASTAGRGVFQVVPDNNQVPIISLTSPANGSSFISTNYVPLEATASDADGSVARVDFYADGNLVGSDSTAPYAVNWNNPAVGTHVIRAVAVDNLNGQTLSNAATVKVFTGTSSKRVATADAFVRDGSSANMNFGTNTGLEVKTNASQAGNNRVSYLKFSLSSITGFLNQVRFRVTGNLNTANTTSVAAYGVSNTSWSEAGITWNNRPALGSVLSSRNVFGTPAAAYVFDVTSYVRQARAAGATSVTLAMSMPGSSEPYFKANSREATSGKPELELLTSTQSALLVVGNTILNNGDTAIRDRLTKLGFTVTIKSALSATSADANGKALVFISSTVASGDVNSKFRNVTKPVVNSEPSIQDDMKMTGTVNGSDFGTVASQTKVKIEGPANPLQAGLTGTPTVVSAASSFAFGFPNNFTAIRGASINDFSGRSSVYGYEAGAEMAGMNAPARRVQLFLGDSTAVSLTTSGWALFDAAVLWAAGF